MKHPEERRQHPRVEYPFMVRYQSRRTPGAWRMAPLQNVSIGGARFVCECAFDVGEPVELQFVLPNARDPVVIASRVVWAKMTNEAMQLYEYGVAFEALAPEAQRLLEPIVAHLLHKQGR